MATKYVQNLFTYLNGQKVANGACAVWHKIQKERVANACQVLRGMGSMKYEEAATITNLVLSSPLDGENRSLICSVIDGCTQGTPNSGASSGVSGATGPGRSLRVALAEAAGTATPLGKRTGAISPDTHTTVAITHDTFMVNTIDQVHDFFTSIARRKIGEC